MVLPCCCLLQAPGEGGGLGASLLGAAAHAVHAVQEQLHTVLEHGRQLAAEQDAASSELAAGGGSLAGESEGEAEGEDGGGGGGEVLPVTAAVQQQSMKVGLSLHQWRLPGCGASLPCFWHARFVGIVSFPPPLSSPCCRKLWRVSQ